MNKLGITWDQPSSPLDWLAIDGGEPFLGDRVVTTARFTLPPNTHVSVSNSGVFAFSSLGVLVFGC